jgi:hypothetical protein
LVEAKGAGGEVLAVDLDAAGTGGLTGPKNVASVEEGGG